MKIKMYTVYDRVAGCYSQPKGYVNEAVMRRSMCAELNEHPYRDDLDVMYLCDMDVDNGQLSNCKVYPEFICRATDLAVPVATEAETNE